MKILLLLSMSLFFCACGDYEKPLPEGYLFLSEGGPFQEIWPGINLGANERYIPCTVIGYDFDDEFIVAKQVANETCYQEDFNKNKINFYGQRNGETYFWVIDVKKREIFGPYDQDMFNAKRKELRVSEKLRVGKWK